jgi:predicted deacetylase
MNQSRRLLASIHDVTPFHLERLDRLVPLVERVIGDGHFALLVVPNFHRAGLIKDNLEFARRLRGWATAGCEIFLHGFTHLDESVHVSRSARLATQQLTAGEGEFLGLSHSAATHRLVEGRAMLEDMIGHPVSGFIAPAWLYGRDSLTAISDQGFTLAEDHFRVWNPQNGQTLARGPVVTYASRSKLRLMSSILWSRVATLVLSRARTVRFAVHPHDVDSPALVREITRALRAFAATHRASAYSDLTQVKVFD